MGIENMTKAGIIRMVEKQGRYCKVRISKGGQITGMLKTENYPYRGSTNTGGRRYIGDANDREFICRL